MHKVNLITGKQGTVTLYPHFFETEAQVWFFELKENLVWKEEKLLMFNKQVTCPRLIDWSGDKGVNYAYSKNNHLATSWHPCLLLIKQKIETYLNESFNFVLCNYYRDGQDYMGWHDDGEKALGKMPVIASVSLGAERQFELRQKQTKATVKVTLISGSLLVMSDSTQVYWQHRLPKDSKCQQARINLTFRKIV